MRTYVLNSRPGKHRRTYVHCARVVFVRARSQMIHREDRPGTSKFYHLFQFLTIPIINFIDRVHAAELSEYSEFSIVYTVYCIQYTNVCSCSHSHTQSSCCIPCQIVGAAKKLRLGSCKGAAIVFSRAAKELRFISASEKLRFRCFLWVCGQNLTKKIKFFQKKL